MSGLRDEGYSDWWMGNSGWVGASWLFAAKHRKVHRTRAHSKQTVTKTQNVKSTEYKKASTPGTMKP